MNDKKRFFLSLALILPAFLVGLAVGHYSAPSAAPASAAEKISSSAPLLSAPGPAPIVSKPLASASSDTTDPAKNDDTSGNIIDRIKAALARPSGGRRTYATFSKLADSIDKQNVSEVLAFVETLTKPQEKSMLTSLVVGRWAEFDSQAAIAYAQNLPPGTSRNWAITSAVAGWAERDPNAATAWAQQLPAGPARDQAM